MEKVWDELRKIEKEAETLQEEAAKKAKAIREVADREAEKMISNSKIYADEEAKRLRDASGKEITEKKEGMLRESSENVSRIRASAKGKKEKAVSFVVDQVLGTKPS